MELDAGLFAAVISALDMDIMDRVADDLAEHRSQAANDARLAAV